MVPFRNWIHKTSISFDQLNIIIFQTNVSVHRRPVVEASDPETPVLPAFYLTSSTRNDMRGVPRATGESPKISIS